MRLVSTLAVVTLAAISVAACNQSAPTATANGSAGKTVNTNPLNPNAAGTPAPAPAPTAANPALAAQMTQAAQQISSQLPIRADAMTSVTGIRAEGTEFVYQMSIEQALPMSVEAAQARMQTNNQSNLCNDPRTSQLIRMGGSMRHEYRSTDGKTFQTRVTSCP